MTKVLVLYHSLHGHVERLAEAQAEGAREVPGTTAIVKRVPEMLSDDAVRRTGGKLYQPAQIAVPDELSTYDAIVFGSPSHFGNMSGSMRCFLDRLDEPSFDNALAGKVGSVFASSSGLHADEERLTRLSFQPMLVQLDMVIVAADDAPPFTAAVGAAVVRGERLPSEDELARARGQGRRVATMAARLQP